MNKTKPSDDTQLKKLYNQCAIQQQQILRLEQKMRIMERNQKHLTSELERIKRIIKE